MKDTNAVIEIHIILEGGGSQYIGDFGVHVEFEDIKKMFTKERKIKNITVKEDLCYYEIR